MESFGLNEEDLSLFGGDLLVTVGSPAELEPCLSLEDEGLGGCHTAAKILKMEPKLTEAMYQTEGLGMDSHEDQQSIHKDPFDFLATNSWLDASVDLLEGLGGGGGDLADMKLVLAPPPSCYLCNDDDVKDLVALHPLSLDLVADQSSLDIGMDSSNSFAQVPGTPEGESRSWPVIPVEQPHTEQSDDNADDDDSGLMMEVLAELSDAVGLSIDTQMDLTMLDAQPVLSPVSVEDIESLLSSPTSPLRSQSPWSEESSIVESSAGPVKKSRGRKRKPYNADEFVDISEIKDIESLLLSSPTSPLRNQSLCSEESSIVESSAGPVKSSTSPRKRKPYNADCDDDEFVDTSQIKDKKLRKKMQNKNAALRYRQKKKAESGGVTSECDLLEERNKELNDKVDSMTREIQYLKDLLTEVYKAKEKSKA